MFVCYSNSKMKKFWLMGILSAAFLSSFPRFVFSQTPSTPTIVLAAKKTNQQSSLPSNSSWYSGLGKSFSKIENWWNQTPQQATLKTPKEGVLRENCQRQWGVPHQNSCIALSKEIGNKSKSPLYVYIPCAVFFSQQHDQPNFACKPGDTLKLAKAIGSPPGINRNVRYIFYGPAGYQPNLATKDYLCQKKTPEKLLTKNCLPLGKKLTLSAGVDSENVHGVKKLHITIYPSAGSIGYSNGSAAAIRIGNQYLGIPTGKNAFDVVVAKTPSWTPPPKKKHPAGKVAKKHKNPPTSTPGNKTSPQSPACADLKAQLAGAEAQIHSCLETLQKSPAMGTLANTCEAAQNKGYDDCATSPPPAPKPTLVSKGNLEGKPNLTHKISCSQEMGKWQARVFSLRKQIAETPSCQAPKDKNPKPCPKGQAFSSASGGGTCVPNGNSNGNNNNSQGNNINNTPPNSSNSSCTQSASAPAAKPKDQQDQTGQNSGQESAAKPNSGKTTASVDCDGGQKKDTSSWPKLPWKGMGLIGAYGGLLGALLLGPIGMFVFGLIGVGVGYLISK